MGALFTFIIAQCYNRVPRVKDRKIMGDLPKDTSRYTEKLGFTLSPIPGFLPYYIHHWF